MEVLEHARPARRQDKREEGGSPQRARRRRRGAGGERAPAHPSRRGSDGSSVDHWTAGSRGVSDRLFAISGPN